MITARYYSQVKLTHNSAGMSAGWQCLCSGHTKMDDAILCNEQHRQHLIANAAKLYPDQDIEVRIIKITEEIVEEAQKVELP